MPSNFAEGVKVSEVAVRFIGRRWICKNTSHRVKQREYALIFIFLGDRESLYLHTLLQLAAQLPECPVKQVRARLAVAVPIAARIPSASGRRFVT
jgi:hypothetical protein